MLPGVKLQLPSMKDLKAQEFGYKSWCLKEECQQSLHYHNYLFFILTSRLTDHTFIHLVSVSLSSSEPHYASNSP